MKNDEAERMRKADIWGKTVEPEKVTLRCTRCHRAKPVDKAAYERQPVLLCPWCGGVLQVG